MDLTGKTKEELVVMRDELREYKNAYSDHITSLGKDYFDDKKYRKLTKLSCDIGDAITMSEEHPLPEEPEWLAL